MSSHELHICLNAVISVSDNCRFRTNDKIPGRMSFSQAWCRADMGACHVSAYTELAGGCDFIIWSCSRLDHVDYLICDISKPMQLFGRIYSLSDKCIAVGKCHVLHIPYQYYVYLQHILLYWITYCRSHIGSCTIYRSEVEMKNYIVILIFHSNFKGSKKFLGKSYLQIMD